MATESMATSRAGPNCLLSTTRVHAAMELIGCGPAGSITDCRARMTPWLGNSGPNGRNGIHAALTGELAPVGFSPPARAEPVVLRHPKLT